MIFYYLSFLIIISLVVYFKFETISKIINLYDIPNKKRKLHSEPTPLLGGTIFVIYIITFTIFSFLYDFKIIDNYNQSIITISIFVFFILGFIDDKFEINAYLKLSIQILISLVLIYLIQENFLIEKLFFKDLDITISIGKFSLIFTSLCLVIFLNAYNMYDGMDGQAAIYSIFIFFILLLKGVEYYFNLGLLCFAILFLIMNLQKKTFLGDNGNFLLSIIISLLIIRGYQDNVIYVDEIFLMMILPGVDMLRLFILRSVQKKSPFSADRQHFHHYLLNRYDQKKSLMFLTILSILPFIISKYIGTVISVLIFFVIYSLFILYLSKFSNENFTN